MNSEKKESLFKFNELKQFTADFDQEKVLTNNPGLKIILDTFQKLFSQPFDGITKLKNEETFKTIKRWSGINFA